MAVEPNLTPAGRPLPACNVRIHVCEQCVKTTHSGPRFEQAEDFVTTADPAILVRISQ